MTTNIPEGGTPIAASLSRLGPLYRVELLWRYQVQTPQAALDIMAALEALLMPALPPPEPMGTAVPAAPPPDPGATDTAAHPDTIVHHAYEQCPVCEALRRAAFAEAARLDKEG